MLLTGTVGTLFFGAPNTHTHECVYMRARVYNNVHAKKLIYGFDLIFISVRVPNNFELRNV